MEIIKIIFWCLVALSLARMFGLAFRRYWRFNMALSKRIYHKRTFGQVIKDLRLQKGLTKDDVASMINQTAQVIENWETGFRNPSLAKAMALAQVYDVEIDDMIRMVDEYAE